MLEMIVEELPAAEMEEVRKAKGMMADGLDGSCVLGSGEGAALSRVLVYWRRFSNDLCTFNSSSLARFPSWGTRSFSLSSSIVEGDHLHGSTVSTSTAAQGVKRYT